VDTQLEQFSAEALGAPQEVLAREALDQVDTLNIEAAGRGGVT